MHTPPLTNTHTNLQPAFKEKNNYKGLSAVATLNKSSLFLLIVFRSLRWEWGMGKTEKSMVK